MQGSARKKKGRRYLESSEQRKRRVDVCRVIVVEPHGAPDARPTCSGRKVCERNKIRHPPQRFEMIGKRRSSDDRDHCRIAIADAMIDKYERTTSLGRGRKRSGMKTWQCPCDIHDRLRGGS